MGECHGKHQKENPLSDMCSDEFHEGKTNIKKNIFLIFLNIFNSGNIDLFQGA